MCSLLLRGALENAGLGERAHLLLPYPFSPAIGMSKILRSLRSYMCYFNHSHIYISETTHTQNIPALIDTENVIEIF